MLAMRRLPIAAAIMLAALAAAPAAHADPGGGAFQASCTRFPGPFPGAIGGEIIITPSGNILANCRYPGSAEGGGVESVLDCEITPAGNFQCTPQ
jgi:hypothetical protein